MEVMLMKMRRNLVFNKMNKKILVGIILLLSLLFCGCTVYPTEITERYVVEDFEVYEQGIGVVAEDGQSFFVQHTDVYPNEETILIVIRRAYIYPNETVTDKILDTYLYLTEEDVDKYVEERKDAIMGMIND